MSAYDPKQSSDGLQHDLEILLPGTLTAQKLDLADALRIVITPKGNARGKFAVKLVA
jgi:hypothetical protein